MADVINYTGIDMQADPPLTRGVIDGKLVWFIAPDGNMFSVNDDGFCKPLCYKSPKDIPIEMLEWHYGMRLNGFSR